jgi:hypothetical protein
MHILIDQTLVLSDKQSKIIPELKKRLKAQHYQNVQFLKTKIVNLGVVHK